ncbi:unnamed protein product [Ceutorhynchus assimilis]|uniref:Uncharacterized protein n=1 Tax=Ceutorhynchus assimilis TaxID=467358 RepID=A0A9N9MV80_9CUCU|nr:unnamed protein product [Ceutorhynchus assimilis]
MADEPLEEDNVDIGILHIKRGALKGRLTRLGKYLVALDINNLNNKIIAQVRVRYDQIQPIWTEFLEVQADIEELEKKCDSDEREKFEDSYCELKTGKRIIVEIFQKKEERKILEN